MEKLTMYCITIIVWILFSLLGGIWVFGMLIAIPPFIYFFGQDEYKHGHKFKAWICWIVGYLIILIVSYRLAEPFYFFPEEKVEMYMATFAISTIIVYVSWLQYIAYKYFKLKDKT